MSANLNLHKFKILALDVDRPRPVGINNTHPAFQNVHVDYPVQTWEFTEVGYNTFRFRNNGYSYTGVKDDKIAVSIYPDCDQAWKITRVPEHDAYTISLARNESMVWTVAPEHSPTPHVIIGKYKPDFPYQLFRFEPVAE